MTFFERRWRKRNSRAPGVDWSQSFIINYYSEPPAPCCNAPQEPYRWLAGDVHVDDEEGNINQNGSVIAFATSTPIAMQPGAGRPSSMIVEPSYMRNLFGSDCIYETVLELEMEAEEEVDVEEGNLEITELSRSPTSAHHKLWSFTPAPSLLELDKSASPGPTHSPDSPCAPSPPPSSSGRSTPTTVCSSLRKLTQRIRGSHEDRRHLVIGELIDTEQRYITNLETLLCVFLPSLEHIVAPRDLRLIFPAQLEPLLESHRDLLTSLEERVRPFSPYHGIVGDIFAKLCGQCNQSEFVNMYSAYMNEFKVAMKTLARYEQGSREFRDVLKACQHSPSCEGLSLAAYLLTPVQRMPRYELLLKELIKATPLDHPDNYSLGDAIDRLRVEMVRLNQSIKSCQLACSVAKVKNTSRSRSFRRLARVRPARVVPRLKRHISASQIDDYSSDSCVSNEISLPMPISRPRSAHRLDKNYYRSTDSLGESPEEQPFQPRRRHRGGGGARAFMGAKAASCSDLLLEFDERSSSSRRPRVDFLTTIDSLPSIPSTPVCEEEDEEGEGEEGEREEEEEAPSSPSTSSVVPPSSEEGGLRSRSQVSISSNNSSTSGIGSLYTSQPDLVSTLTPTEVRPPSHRPSSATPTPPLPPDSSYTGGSREPQAARRKTSWTTALRVLKKKSAKEATRRTSVCISSPMDFRHIQHGLPERPKTPHL